jgi:arylsulfatase A-like enzyme
MKIAILWVGCFVLAFAFYCEGAFSESPSGERPNIVFLISDDHGADIPDSARKVNSRTPALESLAAAGVRFANAYVSSPQCSPSRAAIITGRSPHATGTSRLHSTLTTEYETIIEVLKRAGYYTGAFRKVHLGESFQSRWDFYGGDDVPFEKFFRERPQDKPFFLWIGFQDPHRPYKPGSIPRHHNPADLNVPAFLPDTLAVRRDLADYYDEISRMDSEVAQITSLLDKEGLTKTTLVVFTGDNGMPFPGAKGSLYDSGVHVPLIFRWPGRIPAGQTRGEVVSLLDLAPTWIEVSGAKPLPRMEGQSLFPSLMANSISDNRPAFFERNWHDNLDLIRGVRFDGHLLIQNFRPELPYVPTLDLAESPTWIAIQELHRQGTLTAALEKRYFAKPRPEVELYNLDKDPFQLNNLAADPAQASTIHNLQQMLSEWMVKTNDFLPPPIPQPRGAHGESVNEALTNFQKAIDLQLQFDTITQNYDCHLAVRRAGFNFEDGSVAGRLE